MYKFLLRSISFFALFLIIGIINSQAQTNPHELVIPPTTGTTYLNNAIAGDTLANGQRADTLRVYVLKRNGIYFVNSPIRNTGYVLRIKAQDSLGMRPIIFAVKNTSTGSNPSQLIQVAGNVWLKNLIMTGILEADTSSFSLMQGALISTNAAGFDIQIDSCILSNSNGNHVRTDNATRVVKITNCIFGNMGYLGRSNLGAGKAIDMRAVSCDTLLLVNNTFVNFQDRIVRHFQSTAAINNFIFDHNTLVNGMSYHGTLVLGILGNKSTITNNLFIDAFALGNDTDATRQAEFNESGELDPWGGRRMTWIFSVNNTTTQWNVSNNYYSISTAGQNFYNTYQSQGVTGEGSPLTWHINGRISDSVNAFKKVSLTLNNIPALMTNMMVWYRTPQSSGGAGKTKSTTNFNRLLHDYDRKTWQYWADTLNCAYPTSATAYTGGTGGFPVGDLNWFPSRKQAWLQWVSDVEGENNIPTEFTLEQNYPNPFNPSTTIAFYLDKAANTTLTVYNALGQKVAVPVSENLSAGYHKINFNGSHLASGIYFYRLESGNMNSVKKMILIK